MKNETDFKEKKTELLVCEDFFHEVKKYIHKNKDTEYCLIVIDIEHFKLFNEINGREAGDKFLSEIAAKLKQTEKSFDGIAGYFGDDDFCIVIPNDEIFLKELRTYICDCVNDYGRSGFQPSFGEYVITDINEPVEDMYDRAIIALSSIKGNYSERVARYSESMLKKMHTEYTLQSDIKRALNEGEIIFYLQPKCNMCTGKIVGAEALVRWKHKDKGMISPGIFIPVLEKNGSIIDLDCYTWESVFRWQKSLIEKGIKPVPVSVNVSRMDIYCMNVPDYFAFLLEKYNISPDLIEIELTESAYIEGLETITKAVQSLQNSGFKVLMDDFGSGYSSLNMLKNVNIDILKIDMKFLDINENSMQKGLGILESVIDMARMMGLPMITEGIENQSQVDALRDMGCIYAQGYYFYRPIPVEEFEIYLEDKQKIDFRGIRVRQLEQFHIREFLDANIFSDTMVNNILGAVAFYEVIDDKVEIVRVNEQYYHIIGIESSKSDKYFRNICNYIYEEDKSVLFEIFERASENILNGADGDLRYLKPDGNFIWLNIKCFFLNNRGDTRMYYGSIRDVTEQHEKEKMLSDVKYVLQNFVTINGNSSFMSLSEENRREAVMLSESFCHKGMIGGFCEENVPLYFADDDMLKMLGFTSYAELYNHINGNFINLVHPDDRLFISREQLYIGMNYTLIFRISKKDGTYFRVSLKGKIVETQEYRKAFLGVCSDISEITEIQTRLIERNSFLMRQNQELRFLNEDMPGGYHRCSTERGYPFIYMSDRFLNMLGYTEKEIVELFDNKFINLVHPDDRKLVEIGTGKIEKCLSENKSIEYRMLSRNGYIWVIDQTRLMEYENSEFFQGVIVDITETVELRDNMKLVMEHTPIDILWLTTNENGTKYRVIANGLFRENNETCEETERYLNTLEYYKNLDMDEEVKLKNKYLEKVLNRKNFEGTFRMDDHKGRTAWIYITCKYIGHTADGITSICICSDITKEKNKENELAILGNKLETTLSLESINSWEWDFEKDTLILIDTTDSDFKGQKVVCNFPQCYYTIKENQKTIDYFTEMVKGNTEEIKFELPIKIGENDTIWLRILGKTIYDDNGKAVRAVGSYKNITEKVKKRTLENQNLKMLEFIKQVSVFDFSVNLTTKTVYNGSRLEKWRQITGCQSDEYEDIINFIAHTYVTEEYRQKYIEFSNRERLLSCFDGELYTESIDYQVINKGKLLWRRNTVYLTHLDDTGDVYSFMFILNGNNE